MTTPTPHRTRVKHYDDAGHLKVAKSIAMIRNTIKLVRLLKWVLFGMAGAATFEFVVSRRPDTVVSPLITLVFVWLAIFVAWFEESLTYWYHVELRKDKFSLKIVLIIITVTSTLLALMKVQFFERLTKAIS